MLTSHVSLTTLKIEAKEEFWPLQHPFRISRGSRTELLKERPLLRVEGSQGYIHYRKGSVVMYYLREMIGEEAVNRALRKVLGQYGYKQPPYPTSYALMDALREQTPPELQYLLQDLLLRHHLVFQPLHQGHSA